VKTDDARPLFVFKRVSSLFQDESQTPNVMEPSRVSTLLGIPIVSVCGGAAAAHCVAITEDGRAFVWGRNECGQLGLGDKENRMVPTQVTKGAGLSQSPHTAASAIDAPT
jgi:alpha-tubulin suppressor-like RCC1 family protein|tara:strand:+ start:1889 stop:2218 length:330 start_codon:yes stop_codon:yes gene_type:complete